MPEDIDISLGVGRHGAAAVQSGGVSDEVAFGFERASGIVQSGVEQGCHFLAAKGHRSGAFAHSIPCHVDSPVLANGQLRAANAAGGHRAAGLAIDLNRRGKSLLSWLLANVENIAASAFPLVIDQMHYPFAVHRGLWLDTIIRSTDERDLLGFGRRHADAQEPGHNKKTTNDP